MTDLSRLQADADACLGFLVEHQEEWGPTVHLMTQGAGAELPLTLVAVPRRPTAWKAS